MASPYPSGFDNFPTDKADASVSATDHHNDLADAINKIQIALGLNPAGGFSTVGALASLALTPFGPSFVTGDNQHFKDGLGDWVEVGGGAIVRNEWGSAFHPLTRESGSIHYLEFTPDAADDLIRLPISGTFEDGKSYAVVVGIQQGVDAEYELELGNDTVFVSVGLYPSPYNYVTHVVGGVWSPIGDVSDAEVRLRYKSGVPNLVLTLGFCLVLEVFDHALLNEISVVAPTGKYFQFLEDDFNLHAGYVQLKAEDSFEVQAQLIRLGAVDDLTIEGASLDVVVSDSVALSAASNIDLEATENIDLSATGNIGLVAGSHIRAFDANPGLDVANRPALETAVTEADVIDGYNLIRTMLISLGLATDGD